jgi:rod shape-determining protein MreC
MAVYRQDRRRRITLVLLIVTSLALITFDQRDSSVVRSIRSTAQDVISPIQGVADDAISPVTDFFDNIGEAGRLRDENEQLRSANADLRSQLAANADALAEANAVRETLDLPRQADYDSVFASVVDGSTGNFERTFQIDKGTNAGIAEGMPVLVGAQGGALVGQVTSTSSSRSTVRRLDDAEFQVAVQVLDAVGGFGPTGLANGQRDSTLLELQTSDPSQRLLKGAFAVTRGLGASPFPRGLLVGTVVRTVEPSTATAELSSLRPIVDLDRLAVVKVLRYRPEATP